MTTNDKMGGTQTAEPSVKYSFKLMRPQVRKSLKVFEMELERLHQHKTNILKFQNEQNADGLQREHINAMLTIQKLNSNIEQLERIRAQVTEGDQAAFSKEVEGIQPHIQKEVQEFLTVHSSEAKEAGTQTEASSAAQAEDPYPSAEDEDPDSQLQAQKKEELDPNDPVVQKTWDDLEESVVELNKLMSQFSNMVHEQQPTVDNIEDNISSASENVEEGTSTLAKVANMKTVALPVMGGLVGGLLGGPLGLAAGAKIGAMAALGGGVVGFTSGQMIKKKLQDDVDEAEMARLDEIDAQQNPDLNADPDTDPDANPGPDPYEEPQQPQQGNQCSKP